MIRKLWKKIKNIFTYWFRWPYYGYEVRFRPNGTTVFKKIKYRS